MASSVPLPSPEALFESMDHFYRFRLPLANLLRLLDARPRRSTEFAVAHRELHDGLARHLQRFPTDRILHIGTRELLASLSFHWVSNSQGAVTAAPFEMLLAPELTVRLLFRFPLLPD